MSSSKRKPKILEELSRELFCEWNDCCLVFNDLTLYLQHLRKDHINMYLIKEIENDSNNESFDCQWIGCEESNFDNYSHFRLHVSYHGFHQKLMSTGLTIMKELGPNTECNHDCSARNVLPELPNVFVCGWKQCFTEFLDSESFYRHVDTHATEPIIPPISRDELKKTKFAKCLWISCESAFTSRSHLKEHLRSHTQEKLIACPSCGAMFCNKTKFIDHLYRQSTDNVNNKTDSLTIHVSKSNDETITTLTIQVPQQTDESSLPLNSQNSSILIQNLNSDSELMIIDLANPALSRQPSKTTTINESYQCSHCFRDFATQSLLREHSRSHINKYKCDVCQLTTSSPSALKHHKTYRHENERPFCCKFCDLKFKSRSDLRRHIDTHNEEPPFKCSLCTFQSRCVHTFSKHHKEMHLAVKSNYVCNECDKKFSRGNNLTRHLISIHKYSLPNGCSRFQYQKQEDGDYRLVIKSTNNDT